ncbi:unnamed protein product [Linum tenue]|uniref:Uncharacterized protein n=1 Tax=Linum tenue TaxID=586396 RepID=A0AAV0GN59_9ROSI|nr:unnamed protein product [Linum tenue]
MLVLTLLKARSRIVEPVIMVMPIIIKIVRSFHFQLVLYVETVMRFAWTRSLLMMLLLMSAAVSLPYIILGLLRNVHGELWPMSRPYYVLGVLLLEQCQMLTLS